MSGNISGFIKDVENWFLESLEDKGNFVTEEGDVEDWGGMSNKFKEKITKDLKEYTNLLRNHIR